jgi:hypothetical protein
VVTNSITKPFKAKFVRVLPTLFNYHKSLRVEFKGLAAGKNLLKFIERSINKNFIIG